MSCDEAFATAERAVSADRAGDIRAALPHFVEARRLFAAVADAGGGAKIRARDAYLGSYRLLQ
jgi:hypothetical protein